MFERIQYYSDLGAGICSLNIGNDYQKIVIGAQDPPYLGVGEFHMVRLRSGMDLKLKKPAQVVYGVGSNSTLSS